MLLTMRSALPAVAQRFPTRPAASAVVCALMLGGCGAPNAENIRLRKANQDLSAQVSHLTTERDAQQRQIDGLLKRSASIATLAPDELKNLWVASGISIGRFTGGIDPEAGKGGATGVRVYVSPTDAEGNQIQAAGSTVIEVFDLALKGENRIGRWSWDAAAAKPQWRTFLMEFCYEFTCRWQTPPVHPDLTVRVTFTDELTHAPYVAERLVHVALAPTNPAAAPTTAPAK